MMNKLTDVIGRFFKDEKSVKDVLNFIITLIIILSAGLLIANVFFESADGADNQIIFDNDSIELDEENLYMSEEQRLSDILSQVRGVGEVKVMLTFGEKENREVVQGVIVVAEGAGNNLVREKIITAAQAAFALPVSRIIVMESK